MAGRLSSVPLRLPLRMNTEPTPSSARESKGDLQREYARRFANQAQYRDDVWRVLTADFFQPLISRDDTVLDLGCGWGEFVNNIVAAKKYGMDLNPESRDRLARDVELLEQDASREWPLSSNSLDIVFTSNFFEHLRTKDDLRRTIEQIHRCLRPGGKLICMGPNIRYLPGSYWDFWDHYLPLTERSLAAMLELPGFHIVRSVARFLPYQMSGRPTAPLPLLRLYLRLPFVWPIVGRQFLIIARK
jgi:SAM-dependent methyltransferase